MPPRSFLLCLGLAAGLIAPARSEERERNLWPALVHQTDATGQTVSTQGLGPLYFKKPTPAGGTSTGFRPLYVQTADAKDSVTQSLFLYPLFTYTADDEVYAWSVFELIKRSGRKAAALSTPAGLAHGPDTQFDLWPFWFSHQTGDPATSYRALFPIAGTIKDRLLQNRSSFVLFPLYFKSEKHGATTTSTPWPFLRVTTGAAHGFALWPLFGWKDRPGVDHQAFYLWPLIYNHTHEPSPDAPAGTPGSRECGFLPFYSREQSPGLVRENYAWPFFGYTDRTLPYRYHETRYLWPFLVQGRGEDHDRNRWAPFYTHSVVKGVDKTWIGWPIWKQERWTADHLAQTKTQVLFFLYWSLRQRSATNPALAPAAKTHLWPLLSAWDNGAGRRQFQLLSPLEVFFPSNAKVRQVWTPLFALYRFDQREPGDTRHSVLWGALTFAKQAPAHRSEFHLGPLFSAESQDRARRYALFNGVISLRRAAEPGRGWQLFWLDFSKKPAQGSPATL